MHPALLKIKEELSQVSDNKQKHNVILTYVTSRGLWYNYSRKGREDIFGGVATNIGIYFFDMLLWMFGDVQKSHLLLRQSNKAAGPIEHQHANVQWFLSIDGKDLPKEIIEKGKPIHRSITIDCNELAFTEGVTDL